MFLSGRQCHIVIPHSRGQSRRTASPCVWFLFAPNPSPFCVSKPGCAQQAPVAIPVQRKEFQVVAQLASPASFVALQISLPLAQIVQAAQKQSS